jgi:anti-anti-sigma regulatory factor
VSAPAVILHFSLPTELTIHTVAGLQTQWLAALREACGDAASPPPADAHFRVGAAAVDEIDGAGLQLLVALSGALTQRQRRLQLVDASRALSDGCAALGIEALLDNTDRERATA